MDRAYVARLRIQGPCDRMQNDHRLPLSPVLVGARGCVACCDIYLNPHVSKCSRYDLPSSRHRRNPVSIKYRRAWEYAPMPLSRINISNSTLSIGDRWIVTV